MNTQLRELLERFSIELIYPSKAAKLSLAPVLIAMVIFVGGDELRLTNVVDHLDFVDDLYRER